MSQPGLELFPRRPQNSRQAAKVHQHSQGWELEQEFGDFDSFFSPKEDKRTGKAEVAELHVQASLLQPITN